MKTKLIVFLKNPESGHVKTRIAKTAGNEAALQIYIKLMSHTLSVVEASNLNTELYFSKSVEVTSLAAISSFPLKTQNGADLGERMFNAFHEAFEEADHVIIIGSDCLQLTANHLIQASEALKNNDVVLGPANDGGYYLIGLNADNEELLLEKNWSHGSVFEDAMNVLKKQNKKIHLLEILSDIDNYEDWQKFKHILGE